MKTVLFVSAVLAGIAGISTHANAQNYPWCAYRRDDGGVNCGFTTIDQSWPMLVESAVIAHAIRNTFPLLRCRVLARVHGTTG